MAINRVCFEMLEQFKVLMLASVPAPDRPNERIQKSAAFIKLLHGRLYDYMATPEARWDMKMLANNAKETGHDLVDKVLKMAKDSDGELSYDFLKPKEIQIQTPNEVGFMRLHLIYIFM
jgi:hypothetical protein